jgi:tRNA-dihydrouridine synthase A
MKAALLAMRPYIEAHLAAGGRLHAITRHMVGAFHGVAGARAFRRTLAEQGSKPDADFSVLEAALACVRDEVAAAA